ncbi:hypothetical protein HYV88_03835 [Candidatus Woesearchaeota archaeon]|nr:hypothetical protein [Candidatus Woesearchaeota archaeon]
MENKPKSHKSENLDSILSMISTGGLSRDQIITIIRARQIADRLVIEIPQIATDYRTGHFISEIIDKYRIVTKYGTTEDGARTAIQFALHDLINDGDELEQIATEHMKRGGRMRGETSFTKKQAIFSISPEERSKLSKKYGKKAGRAAASANGFVPWIEREETNTYTRFSELEYAQRLSQNPKFRCGSQINNKRIATELNNIYHNGKIVRNSTSVASALYKLRKDQ